MESQINGVTNMLGMIDRKLCHKLREGEDTHSDTPFPIAATVPAFLDGFISKGSSLATGATFIHSEAPTAKLYSAATK